MTEKITVVPTVKAYPAVLSKLEEAVCVAGFRIGLLQQPEWVRLFPVPFRELEGEQQFKKWQEIEVDVDRTASDNRPESLKPRNNTIRAGRELKPAERRHLVDSMPHVTMCGLRDQQKVEGTSLGVVRPRRVIAVEIETRKPEDVAAQQHRVASMAAQEKLFGPKLEPLEVIPHRFLYHYECFEPGCPGHHQGIIDWEIHQAYRKWRREYPTDFIERVRRKWFDELCGPTRDTRFFVGNMHQHPQSFLVLGVFWPAKP